LWNAACVLLSLTALFWAGNSIVGRAARDLVPPVALAFWRWSIALLILLPFAWPHLRRDLPALRRSWPIVVLLGLLGVGAFNTLLYSGLQHTTALNSMLVQAAQPPLILLTGVLLFGDRAWARQVAGVGLALAGVVTILLRGDWGSLFDLRLNVGDALILVAVVLWSIYSVLLRKRPAVHPLSFLAASFAVGVAAVLPVYAAEIAAGRRIVASAPSFAAIAYVSLFPSLLAYACFNRGVELIGSAATGAFLNVMPVFGAGLAMMFLGERLEGFHLAGVALIAVGVLLATRRTAARPGGGP